MQKQEILNKRGTSRAEKSKFGSGAWQKKDVALRYARAFSFLLLGFLLGDTKMLFDSTPLGFALLGASIEEAPFVLVGVLASAFVGGEIELSKIVGAFALVLARILASLFLDGTSIKGVARGDFADGSDDALGGKGGVGGIGGNSSIGGSGAVAGTGLLGIFSTLFSENTHLRVMGGAIGVFVVGVWRIVAGGFRFYDLFAAIFYLVLTPVATLLFSKYFTVSARKLREGASFSTTPTEERFFDISRALIFACLVLSLEKTTVFGISVPLAVALFVTLLVCARRGILYGTLGGLLFGAAISPSYAPMLSLCALAYSSLSKLSIFGGGFASCIAGLVWGIYVRGASSIGTDLPALLSTSMAFCCAERLCLFEDIGRFFKQSEEKTSYLTPEMILAERRATSQDEQLRCISDSFSSLSEIFYNLSSKLKRPSMIDLRSICEASFESHCADCECHGACFGGEYALTLDVMKKMTVQLHSHGTVDSKKLPEAFKKKCQSHSEIVDEVNRSCAIETKKAFQNEKTEIFALDYDAISSILNDAIAQNESEFKLDAKMSKKIARALNECGYGERSVMVFGKRKLKILARNLDLSESAGALSSLLKKLEEITGRSLGEPSFELSFGSVNMQIESRRAFSADCAFSSVASVGESVCGDTVSIFENKNDYLYALISDGMGTGRSAALASEIVGAFLRNMLSAGNQMDASLRMLNSVLRSKSKKSEDECSATVDLLQLDLYSGALTLVKSGAAPTFVLRRGNVFKLASPSFPIGILRSVDAKQLSLNCEDGDLVVMISDGATRQGDECDFLYELLAEPSMADESTKKIADKIVRRARVECEPQNDDVSAVVIRVKKDVCNW